MSVKGIVFTDLDGTLLFHHTDKNGNEVYSIRDADLEALKNLRQSGYAIVIATGREVMGIRRFLRQAYVAFDYYVGNNGAIILNQFFQPLSRKALSENLVAEVIHFVQEAGIAANMMGTDEVNMYFFEELYHNVQIDDFKEVVKVISFADYLADPFPFTMVNLQLKGDMSEQQKIAMTCDLQEKLQVAFGNRLNIFRNQTFLDFSPLGVSKGQAVEFIAQDLGVDFDHVHVIGDSWNDVSMFETQATSYSFHHAESAIQTQVDHVVENFSDMVDKLHLVND